ncbi:MAG: tRNA dihydrouridine synthase DusB [Firmicutes bacterium]|nr:tRNA dihydrouridine synthase DusB [Bacillota bacterium]
MTEFLGLRPESPMALAPLAGISDSAFRRLAREQGAALSCTEMVSAKGLYYKSPGTEELLRIDPSEGPVGIQIFGSEPDMIAFAADKLKDRPNAFLDINMGCPVPKVVKNGEGSAMLLGPDNAARCVEAAVKHGGGKPVTVKMRVGFYGKPGADGNAAAGPQTSERNTYDYVGFAKLMERAGASAVAVHGRTREQYYSGKADWNAIAEIASALKIPVVGNGDVQSADDARRMMEQTGCGMVLIGRAALGDPWIFAEWKDGCAGKKHRSAAEISAMMLRHFQLLRQIKGDRTAVMEMRKHFGWYTKGVRGAAELRRQVNTASDAVEMMRFINDAALLDAAHR